ncbi:hypothetical protein [Burkholderia sp. Ac-20345]|uniref:hypothetical protein n=1 Tax=Burkholderia sp. Ac-20345 TaxID=2703891 RepID=UPI00197B230F|nr:hypothetical protein [Burkholderia sp. Ac-20345]
MGYDTSQRLPLLDEAGATADLFHAQFPQRNCVTFRASTRMKNGAMHSVHHQRTACRLEIVTGAIIQFSVAKAALRLFEIQNQSRAIRFARNNQNAARQLSTTLIKDASCIRTLDETGVLP